MPDSFDPYLHWLGIQEAIRPLDHYSLLGLSPFEDNPSIIKGGLDRQMAKVQNKLSGENGATSQRLRRELEQAKDCLLNAEAKHDYDRQLRKKRGEASSKQASTEQTSSMPKRQSLERKLQSAPKTKTPPPIPPPIIAQPSAEVHQNIANYAGLKRSQISPLVWIGSGGGILFLLLLIGIAALIRSKGNADNNFQANADPSGRRNSQSPSPPIEGDPPTNPNQDTLPEETDPGPEPEPHQPDEPSEPSLSAPNPSSPTAPPPWDRHREVQRIHRDAPQLSGSEQTIDAMVLAREALAERDYSRADNIFDAISGYHLSIQEKDELNRLRRLRQLITHFWDAVDHGAASLTRGTSLIYRGEETFVIVKTPRSLTVQDVYGRKHEFVTLPSLIDTDLALILAERGLAKAGATKWGILATFLALDHDGDIQSAREMTEEAIAGGWPANLLLVELEFDYRQLSIGLSAQ